MTVVSDSKSTALLMLAWRKIDSRFAQFWLIGSGHSEEELSVESTQKTDTFIFRQNQARDCVAKSFHK
jgi:hypothetical protein